MAACHVVATILSVHVEYHDDEYKAAEKQLRHFYSLISSVLFRTCNTIYMSCILYTSVKRNNSIMFLLLLRKLKAFGIVLMK